MRGSNSGVQATGLEPSGVTNKSDKGLQNKARRGGALSGAFSGRSVLSEADLRLVVENWGKISEPVKAGILAMIKAELAE